MKLRNIEITFDKAVEWYHSGNEALRSIALQAYDVAEIENNFCDICDLSDALGKIPSWERSNFKEAANIVDHGVYVRMKLALVTKVLNNGYDMCGKDFEPYYPLIKLCTKEELKKQERDLIGNPIEVTIRGNEYLLACCGTYKGTFAKSITDIKNRDKCIALIEEFNGLTACATEEIAEHLGRFFLIEIFEAKCYCDWLDYHFGWKTPK